MYAEDCIKVYFIAGTEEMAGIRKVWDSLKSHTEAVGLAHAQVHGLSLVGRAGTRALILMGSTGTWALIGVDTQVHGLLMVGCSGAQALIGGTSRYTGSYWWDVQVHGLSLMGRSGTGALIGGTPRYMGSHWCRR